MTTSTNVKDIANYLREQGIVAPTTSQPSISEFARKKFYTSDAEPPRPIRLLPHQIAILEYALGPDSPFTTIVYSTVKKSGKTTIAGLVGRWAAETWGHFQEIYSIANDYEQAKGRIYQKVIESIEMTPGYNAHKRELIDINPGSPTYNQTLWRILDKISTYVPNGTKISALAGDFKGEAGSNPSLTLFTELWGYTSEAARRMWDEMTPVPTRKKSIRFIETYAGFEDESDLLLELYHLGHDADQGGQRIDLPGWPFNDPSPTYVNMDAGLFMYWDDNAVARRMPWQTPSYYIEQAKVLRPNAFDRLHLNLWTSSTEALLPLEWWDACHDPSLDLEDVNPRDPAVIAVDASVSNDCTGMTLVTRNPKDRSKVAIRKEKIWVPTPTHRMNYEEPDGLVETIKDWCQRYYVVEVAYDAYQLHQTMTNLNQAGVAWCKPFSQGQDRMKADKSFHDAIRDGELSHADLPEMRNHLKGAGSKTSTQEDTKFRIVKKSNKSKIDLVVCGSMSVHECKRLLLD